MTLTESLPVARKPKPKAKAIGLMVRLPPDLHKRIVERAASHDDPRSLNSEIIRLLKVGLGTEGEGGPAFTASGLSEIQTSELELLFRKWGWRGEFVRGGGE
jgi:plasmid stability protein